MAAGPDPQDDPRPVPPGRDLAVPPTPVGAPRSVDRALAALAVVVGVIALTVALAQPPVAKPRSSEPVASPGPSTMSAEASVSPAATPAGPAGTPVTGVPARLGREQLRDQVLAGEIIERLVFVDGDLRVTHVRCQSPAQGSVGCVDLEIPGLGLPVWAGADAIPWHGDPPRGAWVVTVARAGGLVYLGSLVPQPDAPPTIVRLNAQLLAGDLAEPPRTLYEVEGWLLVPPEPTCYRPGVAATPCPVSPPFLAADPASPDGAVMPARGSPVELASPVIDLDPLQVVTPGRYLVMLPEGCDPADAPATCGADPRWRVVARYVPAHSVRVLAP